MAKQCIKCGNLNDDIQNFCTNCGNPLIQSAAQTPQGFQTFQPSPAPNTWQPPAQTPPPGYYYPPQGQAQPSPQWANQAADSRSSEFKELFDEMLNANKKDASPVKDDEKIPERNFPALKLLRLITPIVAWFMGGLLLILGLSLSIFLFQSPMWWAGLIMIPVYIIAAFFALVVSFALGDFIRLLINLEDNTRRSANK